MIWVWSALALLVVWPLQRWRQHRAYWSGPHHRQHIASLTPSSPLKLPKIKALKAKKVPRALAPVARLVRQARHT